MILDPPLKMRPSVTSFLCDQLTFVEGAHFLDGAQHRPGRGPQNPPPAHLVLTFLLGRTALGRAANVKLFAKMHLVTSFSAPLVLRRVAGYGREDLIPPFRDRQDAAAVGKRVQRSREMSQSRQIFVHQP